jgi:hypothetical protein
VIRENEVSLLFRELTIHSQISQKSARMPGAGRANVAEPSDDPDLEAPPLRLSEILKAFCDCDDRSELIAFNFGLR